MEIEEEEKKVIFAQKFTTLRLRNKLNFAKLRQNVKLFLSIILQVLHKLKCFQSPTMFLLILKSLYPSCLLSNFNQQHVKNLLDFLLIPVSLPSFRQCLYLGFVRLSHSLFSICSHTPHFLSLHAQPSPLAMGEACFHDRRTAPSMWERPGGIGEGLFFIST